MKTIGIKLILLCLSAYILIVTGLLNVAVTILAEVGIIIITGFESHPLGMAVGVLAFLALVRMNSKG